MSEDIDVIDVDGCHVQRLTSDPVRDRYPAWSPDGSRIAFLYNRSGVDQVWTMEADGSDQHQRTVDPIPKGQPPEWSPDGRELGCTTSQPATPTQPAAGDVFVVDPDGTEEGVPLTSGPEVELGPTWSPDGTELAFAEAPHGGRSGRQRTRT